jgi:ribosomal protein L37AE/L43A
MAELTSKPSPDGVFGTKAGSKSCKLPSKEDTGTSPLCPQCSSKKVWRDGLRSLSFGEEIQRWLCRDCRVRFSDPNSIKNAKKAVETIESKRLKSKGDKVINSQICVMETKNLIYRKKLKLAREKKTLT